MNQVRLCCEVTAEAAWELAERLEIHGALGVSLIPTETDARLLEPAPGSLPLSGRLRLEALFDTRARAKVAATAIDVAAVCRYEPVPERDWVAAGEAGFSPRHFGEQLWIVPAWEAVPDPGAANVVIAPGLAFGTGNHPSTALCLDWLAAAALAGKTIVDYGSGSGILAMAAARLRAARVWAVDNDPQARAATRANAGRNGVAVTIAAPDMLEVREADVLIANILARPLIALAAELCARVRIGGRIVLAGMTSAQADVVAAAYLPAARLSGRRTCSDWACLELVRGPD